MRFFKILPVLILFLIAFYRPASAQNDASVLNDVMAKTAKAYNDFPIEKVYLHFDKPYYALGDTLWFKAYLTIDHHQLSPLSKIINVLILSSRDSLVDALKLQVKNGVAWSSLPLSQYIYKKGNYRIVAYTNWMNNGDPSYFFNKNVTIGDAINNNLSTQISLKSSFAAKQSKVTAGIYFRDNDGKPYVDKKINWSIERDYDPIGKGKGVTDKNGFMAINFINLKNLSLDSAVLITTLDNGARKPLGASFPLKTIAKPNDVQFFPEGGSLIVGMQSRVAFKALKPDGLGIDLKGTITDNENKVITEFSSSHLGMGAFVFAPVEGKTYTANVTYADGTTAKPDLPKILTGGVNVALENSDADMLKLKLMADPTFLAAYKGKTFFILAKSSGVICFAAQTQLNSQVYSASIPKSKFPTGIVQVTLFSLDGEPMSERVAFIMHNDLLNIGIKGDHPDYTTRQLVKLDINAKSADQPTEGSFSVAVVDDQKVPADDDAETTILTNLLLTSDIKGYIEKPNYYFNHNDEKTRNDLDILMQTQGYRRFSYDAILSGKAKPVTFLPETGMNIAGTLRLANGIPVSNGNIRLFIADKNFSQNAVTNADGRFVFQNVVFTDSAKIVLSARNNPRSAELVITVDGDAGQRVPNNLNTADQVLNIDSVMSAYLKNSKVQFNNTNTLKEVVIRDTKIVKKVSHKDFSSLASLSSEADHTISGELLKGCPTVLQCVMSLANGMTFDNGFFYVSRDYNQGKRVPAQVFMRGSPVDVGAMSSMLPESIESIEIFTKDELGLINSAYGTNGAIVINMKKAPETTKISLAELKQLIPQQNEITISPKGYAAIRTFYLPRYSGPRRSQTNRVDTRSTIYWNPNVITDKTGAAQVEYFNADGTGTYRVIVEGIDKDGNLGRQVIHYTVK